MQLRPRHRSVDGDRGRRPHLVDLRFPAGASVAIHSEADRDLTFERARRAARGPQSGGWCHMGAYRSVRGRASRHRPERRSAVLRQSVGDSSGEITPRSHGGPHLLASDALTGIRTPLCQLDPLSLRRDVQSPIAARCSESRQATGVGWPSRPRAQRSRSRRRSRWRMRRRCTPASD